MASSKQNRVAVALVLCLLAVHQTDSFGSGAPGSQEICQSMMPKHGAPAQTSKSPYSSSVAKVNVMGGDKVKFTLNAPNGDAFKGFLAMVRKPGDTTKAYGKFSPTSSPDAKTLGCFGSPDSAMTHVSNSDKKSVTLEWVAPNDGDLDALELVVTYVKKADTIWQAVPHTEKLTVKKNLQLKAPEPQKRIGDSLRKRLVEAYDCTGKGCLGIPSGCIDAFKSTQNNENPTTCVTFLSWAIGGDAQAGDKYKFSLVGPMPADGYIAMAFSDDEKMGEDSVAGCFVSGGTPGILRFVNPNGQGGNEAHGNPQLGLKAASAGVEEGHIFCNFEQESHTIPNKITVNLKDDKYYYLLAHGTGATPAGLHYHDRREYSSAKISVYDVGEVVTTTDSRILIQLHGAFMIVAWLLCASTGMFTARYYKLTHTDIMPFHKAFWFVVHIFCMFSTVFLTICGIIFIVIKQKGYKAKNGDDILWHPVLGTILSGLALFQVMLAFIRPDPGAPLRPIFNWFHWTIGNSAHIVGIACIFLANDLAAANLNKDEYMFIMMGAVLFHIVMHLILSFHTLWADKQMDSHSKRAVVPGPMKPNGLSSEAPGTGFRTGLLFLYFIGLLGCSAALLYYVLRPLEVTVAPTQ